MEDLNLPVCVECFKRMKVKKANRGTDAALRGRVIAAIDELMAGVIRSSHQDVMAEVELVIEKSERDIGNMFRQMENANASFTLMSRLLSEFRNKRAALLAKEYSSRRKEANYVISKEEIRLIVFARDGFHCRGFDGNPKCSKSKFLTVDHIIPVVRDGTDDLENLQTLCFSCNCKKGKQCIPRNP